MTFLSRTSLTLLAAAAFSTLAGTAGAQTLMASAIDGAAAGASGGTAVRGVYKPMNAEIQSGSLKIDGFTAKLGVNDNIRNAGYMSIFLPGTGTAVVSLNPMPGATLVPDAFHDKQLSFSAGGREFVLASNSAMLQGASYADAYVLLDPATADLTGQPALGFGDNSNPNPGPTMVPERSVVGLSVPAAE
jgi:hypothetical protein